MSEAGFVQLFQGLVTWLLANGFPPGLMPFVILGLELVILALFVVAIYWITRLLLFRVVRPLLEGSEWPSAKVLCTDKVLKALTQFTPAVVFVLLVPTVFRNFEDVMPLLATGTYVYLVGVLLRSALTFLDAYRTYVGLKPSSRGRPVDIWVQVWKINSWAIAVVLWLAIIVREPPAIVLGGLGATSAVLLLVFRDTLLGFVAGIQLYAMDMVRVGDWIEMDDYGANGDVVEIYLTTVKVRNWDRTMTTVPTYALISDSVKNWRFMSEGGARRIKRALLVDVNSVSVCDEEMLGRYGALEAALPAPPEDDAEAGAPEAGMADADGHPYTNLGMFRRYIERYLRTSSRISQDRTQIVRHLDPTRDGVPLEVYAFSNDARWTVYEKIQSSLFEHLMVMAPQYDLVLFQGPAGRDFKEEPQRGSGSGAG